MYKCVLVCMSVGAYISVVSVVSVVAVGKHYGVL